MRIRVGSTRLFFDVEGAKLAPVGGSMRERPTLVLLHGGPGVDHSTMRDIGARFADVMQVVYVDLRGHGRSDHGVPATWNLETWSRDLYEFCRALEIEKPCVMGASFGATVALQYAAAFPEHPGKLVLASPTCRLDRDVSLDQFATLGGHSARHAAEQFFDNPTAENRRVYDRVCLPLHVASKRGPSADAFARIIRSDDVTAFYGKEEAWRVDLRPMLPQVQCPVLILAGAQDPIAPIELIEEVVDGLGSEIIRFERFADAGHGVWSDRPDVIDTIRAFLLAETDSGGSG